ncbi:MAG: hypothetical protein ABTS16_21150 [Candidatus Accumulibacter phosphatis]|uniref:Uncharacterized protein n=1 Tax=Candidatus Accumulibacter contiguus TaxID=2954381 RepID=A0ABX1T6I1_9PROT|nr:hypothetical protein [Candidatus Accumulibacter contiguus]NMQ05260.1 hypothetical protein [Candidatus Accumulibacter contiguus]
MSSLRSAWPAKDPEEALVAEFYYANEVQAGETITGMSVSCSVLSGVDPDPAAVLNGTPTISGSSVLQPFHAGLDGVNYRLRCVATFSSGRILVRAASLPVRMA